MLALSSDSFFLLYTPKQVYVVPAFSVLLGDKNRISTSEHYVMPLSRFYAEFFKCFVGDHLIAPRMTTPQALADWARSLRRSRTHRFCWEQMPAYMHARDQREQREIQTPDCQRHRLKQCESQKSASPTSAVSERPR